ncbi:2-C-methyl-D-erythritol 4-phosphate cytidylyltransferase [Enterocloster sp. OA13]|uniref:2-C-methyl-D-erythritol 4-phosphate cytidylyltransferase n=1 Tax=Enterocloster sp. OA13 TaxID=2914161 RepID=UPI001F051741|nr:2-C-methyl-D-erythritol 4-phosphate cytidylyltransferase [Enterocloster sp. OA13]
MFIKVVPNVKGNQNTCFCYLVESYRDHGKIKHRTLKNFGLLENDQVPYLKAMYAKKKPRLIYDDEGA